MATVAELKAEAKRRGITVPPKAKKAEIEALLAEPELTVVAAVQRDLEEVAKRDPALARSATAAAALELARQLDDPNNSATSKSMCARALTETLDRLQDLAPAEKENDRVDELSARRAARRAAIAPH